MKYGLDKKRRERGWRKGRANVMLLDREFLCGDPRVSIPVIGYGGLVLHREIAGWGPDSGTRYNSGWTITHAATGMSLSGLGSFGLSKNQAMDVVEQASAGLDWNNLDLSAGEELRNRYSRALSGAIQTVLKRVLQPAGTA